MQHGGSEIIRLLARCTCARGTFPHGTRTGDAVTKIKTFLMHASISRMSWLAILAAWLLARGGMMFLVHPMIVGDQTAYIQFARDFLASNGTVLSGRSPAYVVFL